jgi:hypothetical protein
MGKLRRPVEPRVYLALVGDDPTPHLYKSKDPRLVKRHILDSMVPPDIVVRVPTTEEAMGLAVDGVEVVDLTPKPEPAREDMLTGVPAMPKHGEGGGSPFVHASEDVIIPDAAPSGASALSDELDRCPAGFRCENHDCDLDHNWDRPAAQLDDPGVDQPRLAPGESLDADGEVISDDADLMEQPAVVTEDDDCPI